MNLQTYGSNGTCLQTAITSGTFEQQWGLDATGITNSIGTAWATPTYDGAGNMFGRESLAAMSGCYTASADWQDSLALALKTLW